MSTAKQQKSNVIAKQVFEVSGGWYYDKIEIPGYGESTIGHRPQELNDLISPEERKQFLSDIKNSSDNASYAMNMLHTDISSELLDALLMALKSDSINAPQHLIKYKDEPRVLTLLTEAYKQFPLDELHNLPWAINLIGADNTEEILLLRFEELLNDQDTFLDDEFCNTNAYNLGAITVDILSRNPSNLEAFNAFVKLLDHPCVSNQQNTVATFLSRAGAFAGTEVLAKMHQAIKEKNVALPILEINDALPNNKIFKALLYKRVRTTVRKLRELLFSDEKYWWAEQVLWQLPLPYHEYSRKVLLEYLLSGKTTLLQTQYLCSQLGDLVPEGFLAKSLAKEKNKIKALLDSESPSKRLSGMQLLDHLDPKLASKLASYALLDEPDPALQNKMKRFLDAL